MFSFKEFPTLTSTSLILRQANLNDVEAIYELRSSEVINKYVATKRLQNLEEAKEFITNCHNTFNNKTIIAWVIEHQKKVIGSIVLHRISLDENYAEIGYKLKPAFQQKGFMSQAIQAVIKFGFKEMALKTIEAFTHKNNSASITLLEKHNFVFQPERRDKDVEDYRIFKLKISSSTGSD